MSIDTKLAKRIVKDLFKKQRTNTPDRRLMHPLREWFIGVGLTILILGFATHEAFKLYLNYSQIDSLGRPPINTAFVYREVEVAEALNYLSERNVVHQASLKSATFTTLSRPSVLDEGTAEIIPINPSQPAETAPTEDPVPDSALTVPEFEGS